MNDAAGRIRPAAPYEREALAPLLSGLLDHHGPHPRLARARGSERELEALLAPYLDHPDGRLLVAERERALVGMLGVAIVRRSALFQESARGQIELLYVCPQVRRVGLGSALVREALAWLRRRGLVRVELEVALSNAQGRAFWSAQGFRPIVETLERRL